MITRAYQQNQQFSFELSASKLYIGTLIRDGQGGIKQLVPQMYR